MRAILVATTLLAVAGGFGGMGVTSAEAREYQWCSRTSASGFNPSCTFTSYAQCMATVSGQRGDCIRCWLSASSANRAGRGGSIASSKMTGTAVGTITAGIRAGERSRLRISPIGPGGDGDRQADAEPGEIAAGIACE